jgi:GNAT superfamily N-acetyltransferase
VIRAAGSADLARLGPVERDAAQRFREAGLDRIAEGPTTDPATLAAALSEGLLWVAEAEEAPAGFLAAAPLEGWLFVREVAVARALQGQGLGRALLGAAAAEATRRGLAGLALTTFRDIPWNGPWYARLGFAEVVAPDLSPGLAQRLAQEAALGLGARIAMRRPAGRA